MKTLTTELGPLSARFLIAQTGNLDVLRFSEGSRCRATLPTWAPGWIVSTRGTAQLIRVQSKPYELAFDPSPEIPVAQFSDDLTSMTTRGFITGHLTDDGDCIFSGDDPC